MTVVILQKSKHHGAIDVGIIGVFTTLAGAEAAVRKDGDYNDTWAGWHRAADSFMVGLPQPTGLRGGVAWGTCWHASEHEVLL